MIRELIFKIAEPHFSKYKKEKFDEFVTNNPELISEYEEFKGELGKLICQTTYWHGTGRYQYLKRGDSKYEGVPNKETYDVLSKIITEGGLKPHYDPWAEKYIKTPYSISLANNWGYGRMYAHYHMDESKKLLYEIAPINFWYRIIIWIQLTEHYFKFALGFFIWYTFSDSLQRQGKVWLSSFRSDINKKWPFWKILTAQSDISGNYPILFAIKSGLKTLEIPKILRFLETRTDQTISFNQLAFIAVPYQNTKDVQKLFLEITHEVEIFPLEFIELYMRQYSLKQIMDQSYSTD